MSSLRLSRAALLRNSAITFCTAFTTNKSPENILIDHFAAHDPKITEHGPLWAASRLPFLGHTFTGKKMCLQYFDLLSKVLVFEPNPDTFPPEEGYIVDENAVPIPSGDTTLGEEEEEIEDARRGIVTVVARGRFRAVKTGRSWEENFIYRLSNFDEKGKIGHWEIWADPLSAWVAVGDDQVGAEDQTET